MIAQKRPRLWVARLSGICVAVAIAGAVALRSEPSSAVHVLPAPPAAPGSSAVAPRAETRLLELVNRARLAAGLRPLAMTRALQAVARAHSQDMAMRGYVGHDQPGKMLFVDRLRAAIPVSPAIGENIAIAQTPEQAHGALVASLPHRRNILASGFRWVGIGIVVAGGGLIITEDFWE